MSTALPSPLPSPLPADRVPAHRPDPRPRPAYDPATTDLGHPGDLAHATARAVAAAYGPRVAALAARIPPEWGWNVWVGPGWYPLICELDDTRSALDPDYVVHQVKEKFGGLRFYVEYRPDWVGNAAIDDAADRSWSICEVCSLPGVLHADHRMLRVTCAVHTPAGAVAVAPSRTGRIDPDVVADAARDALGPAGD